MGPPRFRYATLIYKKFGPFLDLCVSSFRRGHVDLLCIVPIITRFNLYLIVFFPILMLTLLWFELGYIKEILENLKLLTQEKACSARHASST